MSVGLLRFGLETTIYLALGFLFSEFILPSTDGDATPAGGASATVGSGGGRSVQSRRVALVAEAIHDGEVALHTAEQLTTKALATAWSISLHGVFKVAAVAVLGFSLGPGYDLAWLTATSPWYVGSGEKTSDIFPIGAYAFFVCAACGFLAALLEAHHAAEAKAGSEHHKRLAEHRAGEKEPGMARQSSSLALVTASRLATARLVLLKEISEESSLALGRISGAAGYAFVDTFGDLFKNQATSGLRGSARAADVAIDATWALLFSWISVRAASVLLVENNASKLKDARTSSGHDGPNEEEFKIPERVTDIHLSEKNKNKYATEAQPALAGSTATLPAANASDSLSTQTVLSRPGDTSTTATKKAPRKRKTSAARPHKSSDAVQQGSAKEKRQKRQ
eukprot:CAMPEP_0172603344 /NCGR_PEP_ID=MMETSP1068-20121228/23580_1 /TAXON_ID=35684 /ORGANISM="Pseudopedinella elastica, Strain CCMP716" /LENGTH=394 /DNA_ID=CAMNT_0013405047 /DNA_START=1 /DNA_END=1185 /DNA_ORIENTATION=+